MIRYYVTKHVVRDGRLSEVDVDPATDKMPFFQTDGTPHVKGDTLYAKQHPDDYWTSRYDIGKEAFTDREAAVADARMRIERKIASHRRAIDKLQSAEL